MSVKAINTALTSSAKNRLGQNEEQKKNQHNPSFQGFNPVVTLMDAIDRGGFAASFIAQDGIGMVAPRIKEGLNRGRETDENGKKKGPLNWEFARKEGLREILSGPSAFIIPAGILALVKKYSGTSNNVSMDMIKALGKNFEEFASEKANLDAITDKAATKRNFYEKILQNVLDTSTEGKISQEEIKQLATEYTNKIIEIENAKPKNAFKHLLGRPVANSKQDLTQALTDNFMLLRKQYVSPSANEIVASLKVEGKDAPISLSFKKLLENMKDFTDDITDSVKTRLKKDTSTDVKDYIQRFTKKRIGSRFITNMSMFLAVVGFYTVIPKLYNLGLKGNPALKGTAAEGEQPADNTKKAEDKAEQKKQQPQQTSFQGKERFFSKTGDTVMNTGWLKKISDKFEFNGASMSVPAMLTLLFGFCLPPRYFQAQDKYDKEEILVRDISSFAAILFAAKALARGFSDGFAKLSGLALTTKPEDHNKSFWHKLKNYFTPASGVNVLTSEEIISKYTNIDKYPGGINGFFEFLEKNGGNIKKVLMLDKDVKANAQKIVGKDLKTASITEIKNAFNNIKDNDALEEIYKVFRSKNNKFINYAKTMNSSFGALSTLALVPLFMMWLARTCERMTKKRIEQEKAVNAANGSQPAQQSSPQPQPQQPAFAPVTQQLSAAPSMAGFLAK